MSKLGARFLRLVVIVAGLCLAPATWAAHVSTHALTTAKTKSTKLSESQHTRRRMRHLASAHSTVAHSTTIRSSAIHSTAIHAAAGHSATFTRASASASPHRYHERFFVSSFAEGLTGGDITE